MKIDFHFHLEQGTYSLEWLKRTALALDHTSRNHTHPTEPESRAWIEHITRSLARRLTGMRNAARFYEELIIQSYSF